MAENSDVPKDPIGSELVKEDAAFADIVNEFVNGLSGHLSIMETALRRADFAALRTSAHQLKGSGGGHGYPILTERAAVLERHASQQSMDNCIAALDELKQICTRVVADPAD